MRRSLSLRHNESGSSMLEFALAATMLVALFAGTFQWGYSFYLYDHLETAVRSGARYAGQKMYIPQSATSLQPASCFSTAVKNLVVYGDPTASSGTAVVPGLTTSNIQVTPSVDNAANLVPDRITVSVSSYSVNAIFAQITFNTKPSVTFPYTGIYAAGTTTCPQ